MRPRILIVDDNNSIHRDYKKYIAKLKEEESRKLAMIEKGLFQDFYEEELHRSEEGFYDVDSAYQGETALEMVIKAASEDWPYSLIFMDIRTPPGWDGIETISRIWERYPEIEIVICTAYSDYSWEKILARLGITDRLLFLRKPFDGTVLKQMACSLTRKWLEAQRIRKRIGIPLEKIEVNNPNHRILIVDDNSEIHRDFNKVLGSSKIKEHRRLAKLKQGLFSEVVNDLSGDSDSKELPTYTVDSAYQGAEALEMVIKAAEEGHPYALIFVDSRMPPGWDGIETIKRIWQHSPEIEMVYCTSYSDYSFGSIIDHLGSTHQLLYISKPFDTNTIKQMALSLTLKWNLFRQAAKLELEIEARENCEKLFLFDFLSEPCQTIIHVAEALRLRKGDMYITSLDLLRALRQQTADWSSLWQLDRSRQEGDGHKQEPAAALNSVRPTPNSEAILALAKNRMEQSGAKKIEAHHLLASILNTPKCYAAQEFARDFGLFNFQLEHITDSWEVNQNSSDLSALILSVRDTYSLELHSTPASPAVGETIKINLALTPTIPGPNTFKVPVTEEIHCFIDGNDLQIEGDGILPLDVSERDIQPIDFRLRSFLRGTRTARMSLYMEDENQRVHIHETTIDFEVVPPRKAPERLSILPQLDLHRMPQPDMVLEVETHLPDTEEEHPSRIELRYLLSCREREKEREPVGGVVLARQDLIRIHHMIHRAIYHGGSQPVEARQRLLSLGHHLFTLLFPVETTPTFHDILDRVTPYITNWLIVEDPRMEGFTWIPWELLACKEQEQPYFFGERFNLGRWVQGLGHHLHDEVPFGGLVIIPPGDWQGDASELLLWRTLLQANSASSLVQAIDWEQQDRVQGFQILRHDDSLVGQRSIRVREKQQTREPEEEANAEARVSLRLKQPIIGLSFLQRSPHPHLMTNLLPQRVLPFLRAGAGAVVGTWWPVSQRADRVFRKTFYDLLERRLDLGEIVRRSRLAVRRALPHLSDWCAYTLFGDPRARPYQPEPGQGYTTLECLNPDEPFQPGKRYTFRICIRSRPPIWHRERLIQPEPLPEQVHALVMAPRLIPESVRTVPLKPMSRNRIQATISLTLPDEGNFPLLVSLMQGNRHLETLQMMLDTRGGASS